MKNGDFAGDDGRNDDAAKLGTVAVHGRIDGVENLDAEHGAAGKVVDIVSGARVQASLQVKGQNGARRNMNWFEGGSL